MAQDNSIALRAFEGPSPVQNYLSSLRDAQASQAQQQAMERQKVVAVREDQQYADQMNTQAIDRLGAVLDQVKDGDAAGFEQAKNFAVQNKLIDPTEAAKYTVNDLPRIRALSQQARTMAAERAKADMQQREFGLKEQAAQLDQRQFGETSRHNRAIEGISSSKADAKPPAGMVAGPPDAQGNPTFIPKLNDDQAKATGFANRLQASNQIISNMEGQLTDTKQAVAGAVPFVGNALVSEKYQQADQATRDFINAQLRRESGAVIADSEFDNAYKQYIPRPFDKPAVLAQKRAAREQAFRNMRISAGAGASQIEGAAPEAAAPVLRGSTDASPAAPSGWTIKKVR